MSSANPGRLKQQLDFILELDKLKHVVRQTVLLNGARQENDAEHSWHLAIMAMVLAEHANEPDLDLSKVIKMVLVHDVVEIDAGDTYCYDEAGRQDQDAREQEAADRLFNLLPADQAAEFRALWDEFEAGRSPESKFAKAVDRLQPLMHNYHTQGHAWLKHGIHRGQVLERNAPMMHGSETLWAHAASIIDDAVAQGFLSAGPFDGAAT